jgi:branched-chain amino acid transport system permease protein
MSLQFGPRPVAGVIFLAALGLVPVVAAAMGNDYFTTLFSRVLIFALAAVGLNLLLGYGGFVSFGHSLFLAIGAYAVGILSHYGIDNGWLQLACGFAFGGVVAIGTGLICLRTTGMAFIMITLAFAQMFYYAAVSLKSYGGDEGMSLATRSNFWPLGLTNNVVLYYFIFATLLAVLLVVHRLVGSRFGYVLRGAHMNQKRMRSLGFPVLRVQLGAYVISALICIIAGVFLANLTRFVAPSYLQWSVSGELIVMIVLGGMGTVIGPVVGAAALVLFEEILTDIHIGLPWNADEFIQSHWKIALGIFIVATTLLMKQGLYGSLARLRKLS